MKRVLVPLLWLALLVTIAYSVKEAVRAIRETAVWEADTVRLFTQVELDRIVHDSTMAFQARTDSVVERLAKVAERNERLLAISRGTLQALTDSLALLPPPADTSIWLQIQLRRIETLEGSLGEALAANAAWRASYEAQSLSVQRLTVDSKTAWATVDSLQSLIRRTPTCRKIPFLGISVPKLGIGYFATTGGHGIGVGVVVPLGKC